MQDELFLQIICLLQSSSLKRNARRAVWEVLSVCCGVLLATENCVREAVEGILRPPLGPSDREDVIVQSSMCFCFQFLFRRFSHIFFSSVAHQAQIRLMALKQKRKMKKNHNQFCRKYGISQWEVIISLSSSVYFLKCLISSLSRFEGLSPMPLWLRVCSFPRQA